MKVDLKFESTGIPLIDEQHHKYAELVEHLFELCKLPETDKATIESALNEVVAYAIEHLDAEEALMRSEDYPGYETHRKKHDEFRERSDVLVKKHQDGIDHDELLIQMARLLTEWFCEQADVHDKALAKFLEKKQSN